MTNSIKKNNYLFIIESNNDLDMISPIIWKFSEENEANVFIINASPDLLTMNDPRIIFLRKNLTVKYFEIAKDFKFLDDISKYIYSKLKFGYFHRRFLNSFLGYAEKKFDRIPISKNLPTAVFVSYFLDHNVVKTAITWAEKNNFIKVFNNHGITPFKVNDKNKDKIKAPMLDICIFNKNSEKNLPHFNDNNLTKIYHSPRYSEEWSKILSKIYKQKKTKNKKYFQVSFMLSKWLDKDNKELILSTIDALSKIKNIKIILKPHTRGMVIEESFSSNVLVAKEDSHSREIISESNVVLFTRSSIFLDAIILNVPVLHLSFATKVELATDSLNSCKTYNQQDLMLKLNKIKSYGPLYSSRERKECINFYAGRDEGKMLQNIINKIKLKTKILVNKN